MTAARLFLEPTEIVRTRALAEAETWIGTPYRHQQSSKGIGCDCLGLVRGVWRSLFGMEPAAVPAYSPDWAEASGTDRLADAARALCVERFAQPPSPGQIVLFRWRTHLPAKHIAVMGRQGRIIHAYEGHSVLASPLTSGWARRVAGIFDFPNSG